MSSSLRSKLIVALLSVCGLLVLAAILFPIFATAKESSGPNLAGSVFHSGEMMGRHYRERPVVAWQSRSGIPPWMDAWTIHTTDGTRVRATGRGSWPYLAQKLQDKGAELSVAPGIVGRKWDQIRSDEPVLVLTYPNEAPITLTKSETFMDFMRKGRSKARMPKTTEPKAARS